MSHRISAKLVGLLVVGAKKGPIMHVEVKLIYNELHARSLLMLYNDIYGHCHLVCVSCCLTFQQLAYP